MKAHILIVEDQPALYERLRRALVKQRFTIDEYTKSYDEAIQRIKSNTPDVGISLCLTVILLIPLWKFAS